MIEVHMTQTYWKSGNVSYEVEARGHAGAGEYGRDIVCAAVSCLMQTLANEVREAALNGAAHMGGVLYLKDGLTVSVTPCPEAREMVDAWIGFVQDGVDAIAAQYPENVQLQVYTVAENEQSEPEELPPVNGGMNLQYFADGAAGGDGGAAAGEAAAPAGIQEPALRPAQERLARRSGALKGKAAPAAEAAQPDSAPEKKAGDSADAEPEAEKKEAAKPTPEERRKTFGDMMKGEYADLYEESLQRSAQQARNAILNDPKLNGLFAALSAAYDVPEGDLDALTEAIKAGKVKNDEYYEQLAMEKGISVATARQLDKLESENRRLTAEQQQAQQMRKALEAQQRQAAIRAQWEQEDERLKGAYPGFDLQELLENPAAADLMRKGVSMENTYRAIYFDRLMEANTTRTAHQVEQGVAARIQQRGARPSENGTNPGGAAVTKIDVNNMTRRQREELERRARRGERITF